MKKVLSLFAAATWLAIAQAPQITYGIKTVAGSASIGDGGPATAAQIGNIQGIALDRFGAIYLSDTDRNLVRKIDSRGVITTIAGIGTGDEAGLSHSPALKSRRKKGLHRYFQPQGIGCD